MCSAAFFAPPLSGANSTVTVVLVPGATRTAGAVVTVKAPASGPSTDAARPVRLIVPVFRIVKVLLGVVPLGTLPKSALPPSARMVDAGCSTEISGAR